jgi:hypothetical protein
MTNPDYKIEELYDTEELKVYYSIYGMNPNPYLATSKRFDTLDEAKEVVKMMRKYKERIFHYVED